MADQQFCLRWNNFQNNIISSFEYLRSEEDFVDVTLACEGKSLKAHKVILSACSTYFRDLLKTTPCSHPIIVLKDVSYDDLLSLMCFVYQGVVYISQERLTQFLKTAEFLQIKGLSEHCIGQPFARQQPVTQSSPSQSASGAAPPSPQARSGTPSPSPSFKEAPHPTQSTAPPLLPLAPLPPVKRRKPLYPLHTPAPSSTACAGELPGTSVSPSRPSQSSPSEAGPTNGADPQAAVVAERCSDVGQEEALSLVTETSILRQRIEGRSDLEQPVKVDTNGPPSPAGGELAKLSPRPLIMDPNALSMVGRESLGFPFLSQPGTSSLLATTTASMPSAIGQEEQQPSAAMSYDAQMLLRTGSPRYRQRWRCMQPSVCPHCLRTFSNAFNLKQHIINVHTFGNELKCDVCGKVQKNKWYLRKHMVKSHNAPLRRVKLPDGSMVNTE